MKISHAGTEIHAVLDEFAAAHAARDAERLFGLCTDDAVLYSRLVRDIRWPGAAHVRRCGGDVASARTTNGGCWRRP